MLSFEDLHNHSLETPPVLGPVLASMSRPELIVLTEDIAPMLGGMEAPGMVRLAEVLFNGAQWELTDREVRKMKDRAVFEVLAAELRTVVSDSVGDTSGIPPWSEVSGNVGDMQ